MGRRPWTNAADYCAGHPDRLRYSVILESEVVIVEWRDYLNAWATHIKTRNLWLLESGRTEHPSLMMPALGGLSEQQLAELYDHCAGAAWLEVGNG